MFYILTFLTSEEKEKLGELDRNARKKGRKNLQLEKGEGTVSLFWPRSPSEVI